MSATVDLTLDLLARNSVTPADQGCQEVMTRRLAGALKIDPTAPAPYLADVAQARSFLSMGVGARGAEGGGHGRRNRGGG